MDPAVTGQAPLRRNSVQFATERDGVGLRSAERQSRASVPEMTPQENAPSRWRLRPASRLTAAEATATRRAINLGRSVLGASQTLGGSPEPVKAARGELLANCDLFFSHSRTATRFRVLWSLERRKEAGHEGPAAREFAEPGTLSSTFPTNLPLPRSAPRGASSYRRPVLGAGRNLGEETCPIKGCPTRKLSQFAGTRGRATLAAACSRREFRVPRMRERARAVVDRGRRRRLLDPLLARAARLGRRRPRRARRADERLDLPLRRSRRPAAQHALADEDDDGERRALPLARGRGRPRDGLARGRVASPRVLPGAAWRRSRARRAGRRRSASRSS